MTVKTAERKASIAVEIAPLVYADLPRVIAIERRSFPAPWSLAMFVLELSKPSSICLGATHQGELIGYLVCSRYHTVWHVMNVAIDGSYRRRGVATALIEHLFSETDSRGERYTLEVRVSNAEARQSGCTSPLGFEVRASGGAITTTTMRTP
jgi:ribosomal-protein-alanine N-acetyltransferase